MEAVILATDEIVKLPSLHGRFAAPLLPIGGRPVLAAVLEQAVKAGVRQIKICLHNRGGEIVTCAGESGRWGRQIDYVVLREALGTAGALRWAASSLRGPALVLPADRIVEIDLAALMARHEASGAAVTVAAAAGGRLTGVYIFAPAALALLPEGRRDLDAALLADLAAQGLAIAYVAADGYVNPLASLADFQAAQRHVLRRVFEQEADQRVSRLGRAAAAGVWVGRGSAIHRMARLTPPVVIGPGCWIGPDVELGPDVVIGASSVIDRGATIRASTVLPRSYVGRFAHLEQRIVDRGLLINPQDGTAVAVNDPLLLSEVESDKRGRAVGWLGRWLGLALLLVLAPLLITLGVLATLSSGRWPLRRITYLGARPHGGANEGQRRAELRLFEFQLMRPDGQISAVGRRIWQWDLHRLPRLLNVVSGELALVGVRPLHETEAAHLDEEWQQTRYARPAGFTGLWYLQTRAGYDLDAIVMADVYYAVTGSWRTDLSVCVRTPLAWLARRLRRSEGEPALQLYQQIAS